MPNTYSVKFRQDLILEHNRDELQKFITGVVENRNTKMLAIYCNPDHTHILVGMKPSLSISDLVRDIKAASSKFINEKNWIKGTFRWQEGFGAFSYSHSHIDRVVKYIRNQKEHHAKKTFKNEYLSILQKSNVEYKEEYLFEWLQET